MQADLEMSRSSLALRAEVTLNGETYTELAAALESLYFEGFFIRQVATINMRTRSAPSCYPQLGETDKDRWKRVIELQTRILESATQYLEKIEDLRNLAWARVPADKKVNVSYFWTPEYYRNPNWSLVNC